MELDFTRPHVPTTICSPPSSYSQSQSVSTATDPSSYVDMSPGQQPPATKTTATYVDMSGTNKIGSLVNILSYKLSIYLFIYVLTHGEI